jgi:hypothetical protein
MHGLRTVLQQAKQEGVHFFSQRVNLIDVV